MAYVPGRHHIIVSKELKGSLFKYSATIHPIDVNGHPIWERVLVKAFGNTPAEAKKHVRQWAEFED